MVHVACYMESMKTKLLLRKNNKKDSIPGKLYRNKLFSVNLISKMIFCEWAKN